MTRRRFAAVQLSLVVALSPAVAVLGPAQPATARPAAAQVWAAKRQVIVTGQVVAGSFGCVALRDGRRSYTLLGGIHRWAPYVGDTIRVRGRIRSDVVTVCMTGPPLEVTKILHSR